MATRNSTQDPPRTSGRYSLTEKIAVVRESLWPGARVVDIARKHGLARNVLYYWRKVYGEMARADLTQAKTDSNAANELADLRLQVRNLERLLGQRTLELALLRERLGKVEEDETQS
jgi:transposase